MHPLAICVLLQRASKGGPSKDCMAGDGGEGDEADDKGLGWHSSHRKGPTDVEGLYNLLPHPMPDIMERRITLLLPYILARVRVSD